MDLLSWARRIRQGTNAALTDPAPPPPDELSPNVPTPITLDRVAAWCTEHDYSFFRDNDGDLGGLWKGRLFYFFLLGERKEILQVRGVWNRAFTIERLTEVLEVCDEWNAERVWPKCYVRVRDNGMVHVSSEVATDLEHGVTDGQLDLLLQCGVGTATVFFDHLDGLYPDPVASA